MFRYSYWYCVYVIMVSMILAAITMLLVTWGAITEVRFALGFGIFLLAFCMLLEFIGAIVILVYGVEESDILTSDLKEVFFKLIYRMDYDSRANRILKIVQEYVSFEAFKDVVNFDDLEEKKFKVKCCGANGSEDYITALKPVPMECRDQVDGGEFAYGCAQQFAWWLEPWSALLAGVCFGFILIHIGQAVLTSKVMKQIRKYDQSYTYEN